MDLSNQFLRFIGDYGLVNFSLIKRLGLFEELRELRTFLKAQQEKETLIQKHYEAFSVYHLSPQGYESIGAERVPHLNFSKGLAFKIVQVNHLRYGAEQELKQHPTLQMERWVSFSKFQNNPLSLKIQDAECRIKPMGLMILESKSGKKRLYFIHYFSNIENLSFELFGYYLYQKRGLHLKRFMQAEGTEMRILCLFPSDRIFKQYQKRLAKNQGCEITRFLDASKVGQGRLLSSEVWFDSNFNSVRIL